MVFEARKMSPDEGVGEEMKEVEMELEEKEHQQRRMSRRLSSISPYALEAGRAGVGRKLTNGRLPSPPESPASSREASPERRST
ncbi:GCR1-dependent translation factor 1, partial [Friedmanniomyces endolithicus]